MTKIFDYEIIEKIEEELSYIALKIKCPEFVVCGMYRPPSVKTNNFLNIMEEKLENLNKYKLKCLLIGDMNINLLQSTNDLKRLLDIYSSNNFTLCNTTISTRETPNYESLIDHMLTNMQNKLEVK